MFSPQVKRGVFVLEGLGAFATSLYFNYLFFIMRAEFGFTNLGNLSLCALNGFLYTLAAWYAGQFAQRRGYFLALRLGIGVMAVALLVASAVRTVSGHVATMLVWTFGMCFTWPTFEAIISEHEPRERLQRLLGVYNVVWSVSSGVAMFAGGALFEKLGRNSIFYLPIALHLTQLALLSWLGRLNQRHRAAAPTQAPGAAPLTSDEERRRSPVPARTFLQMAWVANPFAYIAMNALIPVIPRLADRFALTPMLAGFFCSVWFFARAASFVALWLWTGWHYRFRWLLSAYVVMAFTFSLILLAGRLWIAVPAQVLFGLAVGLIYYSSLFYSMDVGETKGEHGGFHEAAIGVGICVGPGVGAASLRFFPTQPNLNVWAVCGLLALGLGWLAFLRWRKQPRLPDD